MRTFILYVVLLALFALTAAQSHIAFGGFQRLLPITSSTVSCWDATKKTWKRDDAYNAPGASIVVPLTDAEAYFTFGNSQTANGNSAQIMYATQASYAPVLGNKGVFYNQVTATATLNFGSFSTLLVNKARTRLWVIGSFTKIGATSIAQVSSGLTIALFDISTSKTDPTMLTVPAPPVSMNSIDNTRVWTQGDTLLIYATEQATGQNKLFRITVGTGWTAVTDSTQAASTIVYKSFVGDETLFAYGSNDLLSSSRSVTTNPTYQRLVAGSVTWQAVATSVAAVGEVTRTISSTQWVPISTGDVIFIISGTTFTNPIVTNAHRDQNNKFLQYFYRASGNTITQVDTAARLIQNNAATFLSLTSTVTGMTYDDVSKAVMLDLSAAATHVAKGDYQSPFADPTTGLITEDKTKYISKRIITNKLLLRTDPSLAYDNFFGGSNNIAATTFLPLASGATQTCFLGSSTGYNVYAPLIAHYNDSMWQAYPNLNFDSDALTGVNPTINVVERVGTTAAFFAGGFFRTIDGTVYNSLVKYNADKTISSVGNGVSDYSRNGDGTNGAGTNPTDANIIRYYDTLPATVSALKYDESRKILFVAGTFQRAGSVYVRNFAMYNETSKTWSAVGKVGVTGVTKMVLYNDYLIVAGNGISRAENFTANRIAMYNLKNNTWEPMGHGLSSFTDMTVYNGQLFISGQVNGRRQSQLNGVSSNPSFLSVWNPITRTFNALQLNNLQDLGTTTCSVNAVCDPTLTSFNGLLFQVANGRLYLVSSNTNGQVYRWNGNNFDFAYQQNGANRVFIKNGLQEGSRTVAFTQGGVTSIYQDSENNGGAWNFNWDRTDANLAETAITDLVSSGIKIQFNIVLLAIVALLGLLFA